MEDEIKPLDEPVYTPIEEAVDVADEPNTDALRTEIQQLREEMRLLREAMTGGMTDE